MLYLFLDLDNAILNLCSANSALASVNQVSLLYFFHFMYCAKP